MTNVRNIPKCHFRENHSKEVCIYSSQCVCFDNGWHLSNGQGLYIRVNVCQTYHNDRNVLGQKCTLDGAHIAKGMEKVARVQEHNKWRYSCSGGRCV